MLLLRNLIQPAMGLAFALAFHFTGTLSKSIVIAGACPCATASAVLASTYQIDEHPTTAAVGWNNFVGVFSMALWIFVIEKVWA